MRHGLLMTAVLLGCGTPTVTVEFMADASVSCDGCEMEGAASDSGGLTLRGFGRVGTRRDGGDMGTDTGTQPDVVTKDGGLPPETDAMAGPTDAGPQLAGVCKPCESQTQCEDGLLCVDYASIGHTASQGDGSFCLPPCDDYLPGPDDNPECWAAFSDHHCAVSLGGCRPKGYDADLGVAAQCEAWRAD